MIYLALSETASTPGVKFSFYLCGRPEANRNNGAPRAICYRRGQGREHIKRMRYLCSGKEWALSLQKFNEALLNGGIIVSLGAEDSPAKKPSYMLRVGLSSIRLRFPPSATIHTALSCIPIQLVYIAK
jgi:hypothetical protein